MSRIIKHNKLIKDGEVLEEWEGEVPKHLRRLRTLQGACLVTKVIHKGAIE